MVKLYLDIDSKLYKELKSRAKKSYLDVEKLAEDIIRRSMITYRRRGGISGRSDKVDDALVRVFSRQKKGRKRR
mgnify:CR=1 FL=1